MMDRIDLFHLPFYKKEAFTGSDRGIRFWIGKVTVGEEEEAQDYLRVTVWPEPYAWKHTPDEQKISKDFAFSMAECCFRSSSTSVLFTYSIYPHFRPT